MENDLEKFGISSEVEWKQLKPNTLLLDLESETKSIFCSSVLSIEPPNLEGLRKKCDMVESLCEFFVIWIFIWFKW